MRQPTFAQTAGLNTNANAVEDGNGEPARGECTVEHCRQDKNGDGTADDGGKKPYGLKPRHSIAAMNEERAVEIGDADGKDKCSDEGNERSGIVRNRKTDHADSKDGCGD